jgi:CheY-like chemotaxis protein
MSYDSPLILLVESDPVLAEVTGFRLELLGFRVDTAASAEQALEMIDRRLPDAIVLDLLLPGVDSFELSECLANDQRTGEIPILAISHAAELEDVQRAYAAGVKDYLVVPYNPTMLEQKLEELLQQVGKAL